MSVPLHVLKAFAHQLLKRYTKENNIVRSPTIIILQTRTPFIDLITARINLSV